MDAIETPLEQSPETRNDAPVADEPRCPLCGVLFSSVWPRIPPTERRLNRIVVCRHCQNAYVRRRLAAFIVDCGVCVMIGEAASWITTAMTSSSGWRPWIVSWEDKWVTNVLVWAFILLRDGLAGQSPGKAVLGLQVIDWNTGRPVGFWQSLKRNLPILVPCAIIVMPATLEKGWRWGDHWARTRVIWKKHRLELPFAPQGILCLVCGYDLTGNVSGVCPECGTRIRRPSQQGTSG